MILSEMMRLKREKSAIGWNALEVKHGAPKNSFQRLATGVKVFPTVEVIERAATFLQTSKAKVVLAAAEELGLYAPDTDGRLSSSVGEHSEEVSWAFNDLVAALRREETERP